MIYRLPHLDNGKANLPHQRAKERLIVGQGLYCCSHWFSSVRVLTMSEVVVVVGSPLVDIEYWPSHYIPKRQPADPRLLCNLHLRFHWITLLQPHVANTHVRQSASLQYA